jgi:hypothetical protein
MLLALNLVLRTIVLCYMQKNKKAISMNVEELNKIISPEVKQYFSYANNSSFMTYLLEEDVNALILFKKEKYLEDTNFMLYLSAILKSEEMGVTGDNYIIYTNTNEWLMNKNYFGKYFDNNENQLIITQENEIKNIISIDNLYKEWLTCKKVLNK